MNISRFIRLKQVSICLLSLSMLLSCKEQEKESKSGSIIVEMEINEGTNLATALSPDGKTLAIDVLGRIWLMSINGGEATPITDSLGNARQPSWSPDGSQITFQAFWDGNWHIYIVNKDGAGLKQMTTDEFDYREPHWSPDGSKLVFSSDRGGSYDIWTLDIVGERMVAITDLAGNEYGPVWSEDGSQMAYVSDDVETGGIIVNAMETGSTKRIYQGRGKLTGVSWSPASDKILFNEQYMAESKLKAVSADGSGEVLTLTRNDEDVFPFRADWSSNSNYIYTASGKIIKASLEEDSASVIPFRAKVFMERSIYQRKQRDFNNTNKQKVKGITSPQLAPDGQKVAFIALQDLWLRNADGSLEQLTNDAFVEVTPAWSKDGGFLAFASDREGRFAIWIRNMSSGEETMLIELGSAPSGLSWSSDGNTLAFTQSFGPRGGQVNSVDVNSKAITGIGGRLSSSIGAPTWSPDGKIIAVTVLQPYSSLYREGVNRVMLFSSDGNNQSFQEAPEHWSFGVRGNDGPVWSPDGKYMVVISKGTLWLFQVNEEGHVVGDPSRVNEDLADAPSWSGDSKSLLYVATDKLKKVNIEDNSSEILEVDLSWSRSLPNERIVIHAGGLYDGLKNEIIPNVDVVIEGHRILEIGPHDDTREADKKIDASDAFLMPGLIDLHSHFGSSNGEQLGRTWLSWGVTTVRNPASNPYDVLNMIEAQESGKIIGPRIYFTGSPIDGSRIFYGGTYAQQSVDQIVLELTRAKALDYDMIKTYVRLPDPLQKLVVEKAHEMGLPVTSHELYPAVAFSTDGVEHVRGTSRRGFSSKLSETLRSYGDVTDMIARSGMTFTPTTAIYGAFNYILARDTSVLEDERLTTFVSPFRLNGSRAAIKQILGNQENYDKMYRNLMQMVTDVHEKGGMVVAGTDSPIIPYGFGLHIELESYQDAGLTPFEVLQTATVNNAEALAALEDIGSIEAGKLADMVIVEANPLEDIRNARKVRTVIKNGRVYQLSDLLGKSGN